MPEKKRREGVAELELEVQVGLAIELVCDAIAEKGRRGADVGRKGDWGAACGGSGDSGGMNLEVDIAKFEARKSRLVSLFRRRKAAVDIRLGHPFLDVASDASWRGRARSLLQLAGLGPIIWLPSPQMVLGLADAL